MFKILLSTLIFGLFLQANASVVISDPAKLQSYKDATNLALTNYNIESTCNFPGSYNGWLISSLISKSDSVLISDGIQPLLTFFITRSDTEQESDLTLVVVTTSKDYKTIENLAIYDYKKGLVNNGDLKNPVIANGYIYSRTCLISKY